MRFRRVSGHDFSLALTLLALALSFFAARKAIALQELVPGGEDAFHADGVLQALRCKGTQVRQSEGVYAVAAEAGAEDGKDGLVLADGYQTTISGHGSGAVGVDGEDDVAEHTSGAVDEVCTVIAGCAELAGDGGEVGRDGGGRSRGASGSS